MKKIVVFTLSISLFAQGKNMNIFEAVIPAAGLGTRFLPFTKSTPKELLPLINKPAIQNIIEEGLASGINHFNIITSKRKPTLQAYVEPAAWLDAELTKAKKLDWISSINHIIQKATFSFIEQPQPLGLAHAVSFARDSIKGDYFGIFLPDDIIMGNIPAMHQLIEVAKREKASVVAVMELPREKISAYGVVIPTKQVGTDMWEISGMVEKPKAEEAPSNLAIIGRYVLSNKIFDSIEHVSKDAIGEVVFTDALIHMMNNGERLIVYKFKGDRYDLGVPAGWLAANIRLALQDPQLRDVVLEAVQKNR